jgi:hypothetical protein
MNEQTEPTLDLETARSVDAQCLVLEMSGQTWHVPFDSLPAIPRVGEKIRLAGGSAGKVAEVEYEFAPEAAPVRVAGNARRRVIRTTRRIVIRLL